MLMGQRLCKESALAVATWPAACHGLAGIRAQMVTDGYAGSCRYVRKTCKTSKFLSCCEKNLQIGAGDG